MQFNARDQPHNTTERQAVQISGTPDPVPVTPTDCRQPTRDTRPCELHLNQDTRSVTVSVSVETRRSDDLYTGASPDGDGVEAERWPLLGGDGESREMGRGRLEIQDELTQISEVRRRFLFALCPS